MRKEKALIGLTALLIVLLTLNGVVFPQHAPTTLEAPVGLAAGTTFFEQEAGITAYTKVSSVNLTQAEQAFKNVEKKTDEYIIGSISLSGYGESHDVHAYVDITGCVATYYLRREKASKIMDWLDYSGGAITSTKLEDGLVNVTNALGLELPYTKYYDFRYPQATKLMIITDERTSDGTDSFRILIPGNYEVYSRSWSHAIRGDKYTYSTSYGTIYIDGTILHDGSRASSGWSIWNGDITPTQLSKDVYHTISVYYDAYMSGGGSYVAIVLLYKG